VPNSEAERLTRLGVGGAGTVAALGPGGLVGPAAVGAGGAVGGNVLAGYAPEWAKPAAELGGNILAGGATVLAGGAARAGAVGGANALQAFVRGADADVIAGKAQANLDRTAPLSADFKNNPLSADYQAPGAPAAPVSPNPNVPPAAANANAPPGPAVPRAAGAQATPAGQATLTPAQEAAYRATAEGQKLLEPQQPGFKDPNLYVQGSHPNTAEMEQTVNSARELKSLNVTAPNVSQEAKDIAAANGEARQRHFEGIAGSDVDVANAKAARTEQAQRDLTATWANKTDADAQPLFDLANQIKASPDGRRPVVRNAVDAVTKELADADGNLITDPEQLYGVRKHIDDLMSKQAAADDPKSVRALANLQQMKNALDGVIEAAAPGFGKYLKNFSEASRPIDAMEVLQKHEPKLYDAQNRMGYNRVQTMMRQIVDSRQASGINQYKSIPDETMARLWALRDDLRRSASSQELARTPGSDTAQNVWDAAKGVLKGAAADTAGHVIANATLGPIGSPILAAVRAGGNALMAGRTQRRQTARGMEMLHPDPSQYRNPLAGP
jgi:hypothetical protein